MLPQFFLKNENIIKNCRSAGVLLDISKIFGRIMHKQTSLHVDHFLSP